MSDFWARKLAPAPQPVQQQPAPVAWWQNQQVAPPVTTPPSQPVPQPQYGSGTAPDGEVSMAELLHQQTYTPDQNKVKSIRQSGTCPECGSGNFFTPPATRLGTPASRCAECGYNEATGMQSMSGLSGIGANLPTYTARVQQGNVTPANFGAIIGSV